MENIIGGVGISGLPGTIIVCDFFVNNILAW